MPPEIIPPKKRRYPLPYWQAGFFILLILFVGLYVSEISAPKNFPTKTIISVQEGFGLLELSEKLKDDGVIRSPFWFRMAAIALGGERGMQAGAYYLSRPQNSFVIAWRIVHGYHGLATITITIPEGFTIKKIANLFDERFTLFNKNIFLSLAPEGYMFPDTYFMQANASASSTVKLLRDNFIRKIFPLMPDVEESGHSLEEIIIMASIIENEAKDKDDREIVSGILWKRLEKNQLLQVDATLTYITGKTSAELTLDDLKIKSPYNTYLYPGLPPKPISNPGLESIKAALHPKKTDYMYFLTGNDGKMYYAKTFEQHKTNKIKYIGN